MGVLVVPKPSIAMKNDHVQVFNNTLFTPKYYTFLIVECLLLTGHVETSQQIYIALNSTQLSVLVVPRPLIAMKVDQVEVVENT